MVFLLILQACGVHACIENGILQYPPHELKLNERYALLLTRHTAPAHMRF